MLREAITTSVLVLLVGPLQAQGNPSSEQELITLANRFSDAQVKKDRQAMERLLSDDYLFIHSNGLVWNKTQEIAEIMSSGINWSADKLDGMQSRVFGDAGVVTGRETLEGSGKGYVSGARLFTEIFVKRAGGWQLVGGQATLVPKK